MPVYRLASVSQDEWKSDANPAGWHPLIARGDFEAFFTTAPEGGYSIDHTLALGMGTWLWAAAGLCPPYSAGRNVLDGGAVMPALAPLPLPAGLLEAVKARPGLWGIHVGAEPEGGLPTSNAFARRDHAADALLAPLADAGITVLSQDTSGAVKPPSSCFWLADRWVRHFGKVAAWEPHPRVAKDLAPLIDGRFWAGCNKDHWDRFSTKEGWVGPTSIGCLAGHLKQLELPVDAAERQACVDTPQPFTPIVETAGIQLAGVSQ